MTQTAPRISLSRVLPVVLVVSILLPIFSWFGCSGATGEFMGVTCKTTNMPPKTASVHALASGRFDLSELYRFRFSGGGENKQRSAHSGSGHGVSCREKRGGQGWFAEEGRSKAASIATMAGGKRSLYHGRLRISLFGAAVCLRSRTRGAFVEDITGPRH